MKNTWRGERDSGSLYTVVGQEAPADALLFFTTLPLLSLYCYTDRTPPNTHTQVCKRYDCIWLLY